MELVSSNIYSTKESFWLLKVAFNLVDSWHMYACAICMHTLMLYLTDSSSSCDVHGPHFGGASEKEGLIEVSWYYDRIFMHRKTRIKSYNFFVTCIGVLICYLYNNTYALFYSWNLNCETSDYPYHGKKFKRCRHKSIIILCMQTIQDRTDDSMCHSVVYRGRGWIEIGYLSWSSWQWVILTSESQSVN